MPNESLFMATVFSASIFFCHAVTFFLLSDRKLPFRQSVALWGGYALFGTALGVAAIMAEPRSPVFYGSVGLSIASNFILFCATSYGPLPQKVFLLMTYGVFFLSNVLIARGASHFFFHGSFLAIFLLRTGMSVAFIVFLQRYLVRAFHSATRKIAAGWGMLAVFSVTAFAGLVCLSLPHWSGTPGARFEAPLTLDIVVFAAYILVFRMIKFLNDEHDKKRAVEQAQIFENELMAEREFVKQARSFHHDMRHHNLVLLDYLDRGDIEGVREYLKESGALMRQGSLASFCKNQTANAVFRIASRYAEMAGVDFSVRADIPEELPLSGPETGALFGNLMENAREACGKMDAPFINVSAETRNGKLYLEIRNSVQGTVAFQGELPRTTKKIGGVGLASVESILSRHGGMMHCAQEGHIFITRIILLLEKSGRVETL